MCVVDRHMPIHRITFAARLPGKSTEIRHYEIRCPKVAFVLPERPDGVNPNAELRKLDIHGRRDISRNQIVMRFLRAANAAVKLISVLEEPMKKPEVPRADIPPCRA